MYGLLYLVHNLLTRSQWLAGGIPGSSELDRSEEGIVGFVSVNIIAVIVCAVVNFAIGAVWYSPVLFSKPWMRMTGRKMDEMQAIGPLYAITFVAALVAAFVLAQLIAATKASGLINGIIAGLLVGIGFVLTTSIPDYVFSGRPAKLLGINVGYQILGLAIEGAILGVWT
jgi:hypothetical protein